MTLVFTLNDYEKIGEIGYEGVKNCLNVTGLIESAHHLITNGHTQYRGPGASPGLGLLFKRGPTKNTNVFNSCRI